jgi:hypothetical protein
MKYFSWSDCWSWLAFDRSIPWTSSMMTKLVFRSVISWHAWWVSIVSFVPLPTVRRRLPERARPAEVDGVRVLKVHDTAPVPLVGVRKLDAIGQLNGGYGRMDIRFCRNQPIRHHVSMMTKEDRNLARQAALS